MTYIGDLKCKHFIKDTDSQFSRGKITNFNIIHNQCHGDPLRKSGQYYKTIFNSEDCTCNQAMSSAIKTECDDIHFEGDFVKSHLKSDIEKDLISNGFFIKNARK